MPSSGTQISRVRCTLLVAGLALAATSGGLLCGGCGFDLAYVLGAAGGQIDILFHSVPIEVALESGDLSEEQTLKLELIRDVRDYARDTIGLSVADNYTKFYDSSGNPVAYNVSACRKDAFEPLQWTFPIVGTLPYLGFFSRADRDAKVAELEALGYDVSTYEVDAYSGLNFFPTIVMSPMLERSDLSLVNTVIHELLHSTVWRAADVSFNESLATFFGRNGAIAYLRDRYADQPELIEQATANFEDSDRYSEFALTLFNDLNEFYSSELSSDEKIAGREAVYQAGRDRFAAEVQPLMNCPECYDWVQHLPTNNAYMMGVRRYNLDLDVFERVFEPAGEDWATALQVFRYAAAEADPYAYLLSWLDSSDNTAVRFSQDTGVSKKLAEVAASIGAEPFRREPCPAHQATTIYEIECTDREKTREAIGRRKGQAQ